MLLPQEFLSPAGHPVGKFLTRPHTGQFSSAPLKSPTVLRKRCDLLQGMQSRPATDEEAELDAELSLILPRLPATLRPDRELASC